AAGVAGGLERAARALQHARRPGSGGPPVVAALGAVGWIWYSAAVAGGRVKQVIKQYALEQGALEIQYIEEFFGEFGRKKNATEIVERLNDREHLIHMIEAALDAEPSQVVPVAFKVGHEIRGDESIPKLADLVRRLDGSVQFEGRKVLYAWIGGTRRDWRVKGFFRALSEEQE